MAHFETRPASTKDGRIPNMGESTNEDIGGVMDWQNVGEETAADDTRPPLGPIAKTLVGPFDRKTGHDISITKGPIDSKSTGGVVGKPVYATTQASDIHNVSLNYDGGINPGASTENLSAKYKNPQKKQDLSTAEQNQYE